MRGATSKYGTDTDYDIKFQSTRPARGATFNNGREIGEDGFQSTRPARGATAPVLSARRQARYFNPRAPCGARLRKPYDRLPASAFQSTRPMRGATGEEKVTVDPEKIFQSTRPMRGATAWIYPCCEYANYFNPRAPCGARRQL